MVETSHRAAAARVSHHHTEPTARKHSNTDDQHESTGARWLANAAQSSPIKTRGERNVVTNASETRFGSSWSADRSDPAKAMMAGNVSRRAYGARYSLLPGLAGCLCDLTHDQHMPKQLKLR